MEVIINSIHIKFTDIVDVKQPIKLNSLAVLFHSLQCFFICWFLFTRSSTYSKQKQKQKQEKQNKKLQSGNHYHTKFNIFAIRSFSHS